jgi:hypothetical protein
VQLPSRTRFFRSPYVVACAVLIVLWLVAWLVSFPNIYGWLTDDIYQFARIEQYETGGKNLFDIQWFHAYDWLIVYLPWQLHWSVPSHMVPQAWARTGEFRAFILYIIVLHAALLGVIAAFLAQLCRNRVVCLGALILFMTSPTFMFYSDLLDSRYLGLLAGIPAIMILLARFETINQATSWWKLGRDYVLPGFLVGLGQSLHYTTLYFCLPIVAVYGVVALVRYRSLRTFLNLALFVVGLLCWFVPVQVLSLAYEPFPTSMLGVIIGQVTALHSQYDKLADLASWVHFFYEDMGVPMMIAVVAGAVLLARDRTRPSYVARVHAQVMIWSSALAVAYLVITPSVAFYRQLSAYQIFFMLFAVVAIDLAVSRLRAGGILARRAVGVAAMLLIAFVPSLLRMPEVFVDAQGLGRAVNRAHQVAGKGNVVFIEFYDIDVHPDAIIARSDLAGLGDDDVIVTDFPTLYFAKFPDLLALFHDARPVASYPTEWCSVENWVEERTYWQFRRYHDEPESCHAQVYRVRDLRRAAQGTPLPVASLAASSTLSPDNQPALVFTERHPPVPIDYRLPCCNRFPFMRDIWSSLPVPGPHWLEVSFAHPATIGRATIVLPNYFAPPGFTQVARPLQIRVLGAASADGPLRLLWASSGDVRDSEVVTAAFAPASLARVRFELVQPPSLSEDAAIALHQRLPASPGAGIAAIRFPGYVVQLPR